jgi:hypothetical protein
MECFWTIYGYHCRISEAAAVPADYIPNPPPVFIPVFLEKVLKNDSPDQIPQFPLANYPPNYVEVALTNLTSSKLTKVLNNLPQYQLTQVLNDLGDKKKYYFK